MKNKTIKRIIIIFASIILILALIVGIFFIVTMPRSANEPLENVFSIWQNRLKDDVLVRDVVMPGSHDAGTAGMLSLMETQSHRLEVQLKYGVRYFDVRPKANGGELYPFHVFPNLSYPLKELLQETVDFLKAYSTEFVVLDFQHFSESEEQTKTMLDSMPEVKQMAVPNSVSLESLTVGEMRQNNYQLIIVWNESYSEADRDYLFKRNDVLYSPYNEDAHKNGNDTLIAQFEYYYASATQNRLFVLQAQRTGRFGGEMIIAKLEDEFRPVVNEFFKNLSDEHLKKTNVIMRDYVTRDIQTIKIIIELNQRKGNFVV